MRFDYYYGSQADQFSFIRIPRVMIKDPVFAGLSVYAKLLYSVLLDRMSLSSKNGWFDDENRVYIVYPVTEAQEDLGIGKKKAMEVITELVEFGLLEKKRRGLGLPSLLYVKSFLTGVGNIQPEGSELAQPETEEAEVTELTSQDAEPVNQEVSVQLPQEKVSVQTEVPEPTPQETGLTQPDSEVSDLILQKSIEPEAQEQDRQENTAEMASIMQEPTETDYSVKYGLTVSEVPNRALQEVPESTLQEVSKPVLLEVPNPAPLMSKTDNNYTYRSYLSHLINAGPAEQAVKNDEMRSDRNTTGGRQTDREGGNYASLCRGNTNTAVEVRMIQAYRDLIHENIHYEDLCRVHRYDRERIDGIVDLILETVLGKNEQVRIASNLYPVEIVRSKFRKLRYEHIDYVLDCLDNNTTKVRNIKKYLLAALFNAPSTMNGYYQAEVNHDMPQYVKKAQ